MIADRIYEFLDRLRVGPPLHVENLTVLPLLQTAGWSSGINYLTLEEGLASGQVSLREVGLDGMVSALELENLGDRPVLIIDGEELAGSKQNRVPNSTILAPARSTIRIPVSCVEAGRWSYRSKAFTSSGRVHFHSGRAAKLASVAENQELRGRSYADQSRVWDDIELLAEDLHASSATGAMKDLFEQRQEALKRYATEVKSGPDQVGAVFAIGGRIEGAEIFDRPETLSSLLSRLVESYAIGALSKKRDLGIKINVRHAQEFLGLLRSQKWRSYSGVGIGTQLHLTTEEIIASGLALDDHVVHLAAFQVPADRTSGGRRWDLDFPEREADEGPEFDLAA